MCARKGEREKEEVSARERKREWDRYRERERERERDILGVLNEEVWVLHIEMFESVCDLLSHFMDERIPF